MYEVKQKTLLKKDENKGVMIGQPNFYNIVGFRTSIPTTFKKWNDAKECYQKIIDKAIKDGENILNKEYLSTWGLSV